MQGQVQTGIAGDIAAAMAWWREAGVDCHFADAPQQWLAPSEAAARGGEDAASGVAAPLRKAAPKPPAAPTRIGGDKALWPQDLTGFHEWWRTEPSLDSAPPTERVLPRGSIKAPLMVLVEQPEPEDSDCLLSGAAGRHLKAMLSAMGYAEDKVYLASALPRHTPLADWTALAANGLGEVVAHHIGLASPQRLLVLGNNLPPLLGHDPAQSAQPLRAFNHESRTIPVLSAPGLDALARPRMKAQLWSRWLDWTETTAA